MKLKNIISFPITRWISQLSDTLRKCLAPKDNDTKGLLSLVNYDGDNCYFTYNQRPLLAFRTPINELCNVSHLIGRLSSNDCFFIGLSLGEKSGQALYPLPSNTLSSDNANLRIIYYNLAERQLGYLDKKNNIQHAVPILELIDELSLIQQFSPSHAYQIGFYAGELIAELKKQLFSTANYSAQHTKNKLKQNCVNLSHIHSRQH